MAARRTGTSGRTTPKGTKNPKKKSKQKHDPTEASGRGGSPLPENDKPNKNRGWVSRPATRSRGDR